MIPLTDYRAIGNALAVYDGADVVFQAWEITPEGMTAAFRYSHVVAPATNRRWTIELRDGDLETSGVLFRQSVVINSAGAVTVSTTIVGGTTIDPADALEYLDVADTVEYSITNSVFLSAPYYMAVPVGAAVVITDADTGAGLYTAYQRAAFHVPLVSDQAGTLWSVVPHQSSNESYYYPHNTVRYKDGAWSDIAGPYGQNGFGYPTGAMWRDRNGYLGTSEVGGNDETGLPDSSSRWSLNVTFSNWVSGGGITTTNIMFDHTYRYVNTCATAIGGVAAVGVKGRAYGEPIGTATTIWFRRTEGATRATVTWSDAVEVATVSTFEPYSIWQIPETGRFIISSGRDLGGGVGGYYSDDNGRSWSEMVAA